MICGYCAVNAHHKCNGFLRASYDFCACSDRGHRHPALQASEDTPQPSIRFKDWWKRVAPSGEPRGAH